MRRMMNYIKENYGNDMPIFITENGVSDQQGNLDDLQRIYYYKHYLNQLLKGTRQEANPPTLHWLWLFSNQPRPMQRPGILCLVTFGQLWMGSRL